MKEFNSIDEQINKLKNRNIIIDDENYAKDYLLRNNYYNVINTCSKPFLVNGSNNYIDGTNFSEIVAVHQFEREIKYILFKFLIEIEQHLKSIVSYTFCKYHSNPYDCININSYNLNPDTINEIATLISNNAKIINDKNKCSSSNSIKHYVNNHNDVPYWILCSYLTFGNIIKIYKLLNNNEKKEIIHIFEKYLNKNLNTSETVINNNDFQTMLNSLLELRNVVAHNSRVFKFKCRSNISYIPNLHDKYNIERNDSKQNMFNMVIIMNCFLTPLQYAQLYNSLLKRCKNLKNKLVTIDVSKIYLPLGIPSDFHTFQKLPQ